MRLRYALSFASLCATLCVSLSAILPATLCVTSSLLAKDKEKEKEAPSAETKLRSEAAQTLIDFAQWCVAHGAKKEGFTVAREAESLDAKTAHLAETRTALAALSDVVAGAALEAAEEKKLRGPKIASVYDKLVSLDHDPKDSVRFEDYLFQGLAWEPTPARLWRIRKAVEDAMSANHLDEAGRTLARLERADPETTASGAYEKLESQLSQKDAFLLGHDKSPLVGYVSLPQGWTKGKRYPVLVAVEGAGCNFAGCFRGFVSQRVARPFIVVTPVTLSSTNELKPELYPQYAKSILDEWGGKRLDFDGAGVDALLAAVHKRFGGEEAVFLTGFSGGGKYAYYKLFHDPAHVRGAAAACANCDGTVLQGTVNAVTDGGPPVHLFTGEKDPNKDAVAGKKPGIEAQTNFAQENLAKLGYTNVERTQVKGAGHDPFPALVWDFVDKVMAAK